MLITIIAFTIIILISSIQAYTNWRARKEQNQLIDELIAKQGRDWINIKNLIGKLQHKESLIKYRNKKISELERRIAKETWDRKILRGRKLTK